MPCFLTDISDCPWNLAGRAVRLTPGEVHVWLSNIDGAHSHLSLMERTLSSDELDRAARFRREETRLEFTLGRGLLRLLLGAYLDADPRELQFAAGPHGKPGLVHTLRSVSLQFNVSHSAGTVLHAFSPGPHLGVDIERVRKDFSGLAVARRFFSRSEAAFLASQPETLRSSAFFAAWTRKEALLKARGEGLSGGLQRTEIPISPEGPETLLELSESSGENARWSLFDLEVGPEFAAALVAEGTNLQVTLRKWRGEELLEPASVSYRFQTAGPVEPGSPERV
ncbi:MAG TPA: 4'-phosphopantetheinyl transferase superfamily protein [Terriglobia bacterium]|nr:4'-phosphopantetheinyl transferase superfamily protein [Terriglobia bacterium]